MRPRRLKRGTHVDNGWIYRVYRNHAAALIRPFIFSSVKKSFVILFSETVRPGRLKLGTHVDSGQMCRVYRNQDAVAYSSLYFVIFLSPIFKHLIFSSHFSQQLWGLEDRNLVHTWAVGSCIAYMGIRLLLLISSFFFPSNFQIFKFFITLFSGTVKSSRLKLGTHVDSGQMYRVYRNQASALIRPFIFHFSFSPVFKH